MHPLDYVLMQNIPTHSKGIVTIMVNLSLQHEFCSLAESTREPELLMKFIKNKWLTSLIIFFITISLWLQELSLLKWLQGLNRQQLANMGMWLTVPVSPRFPRPHCKPHPAAAEPTGPASALGPRAS